MSPRKRLEGLSPAPEDAPSETVVDVAGAAASPEDPSSSRCPCEAGSESPPAPEVRLGEVSRLLSVITYLQ
ncbi:hypothetical protein Pmi06nite_70730 [Planotetraspora mira]|uniref:Uncharacterized protein n=1 Tax=Planotetraspora mira TaxID=58121 RepID=A0A8J3TX52_9ACTN|nr:hypothetical protein Pmi06nite_70730 [Planotetraspora mira]